MIQRVEHESRIHLDIESDDIDAEVLRLEALGARRNERIRTWVVMEAPTGQRFCVVRPQRPRSALPSPARRRSTRSSRRWRATTRDERAPGSTPRSRRTSPTRSSTRGPATSRRPLGAPRAPGQRRRQAPRGGDAARVQRRREGIRALLGGQLPHCRRADDVQGRPHEDGVVAVTGSYAAGDERWGWRNELSLTGDKDLTMRASTSPRPARRAPPSRPSGSASP